MQAIKGKKRKKFGAFRALAVVVLLIVAVNVLYLFVQQRLTITQRQEEYDMLKDCVDTQKMENEELRAITEKEDMTEYMEKIARETMDYAYPGEQVYVNVAGMD